MKKNTQAGFTLLEAGIAMVVGLSVIGFAATMGADLLNKNKAEGIAADIRRVSAETRRIYGDSGSGYTTLTTANLKASTSGLDDLWTGTAFRAGDSDLTIGPGACTPAAWGVAGDGFSISLRIEPKVCKDLVHRLSSESIYLLTVKAGGGQQVMKQPGSTEPTPALISAACDINEDTLVMGLCTN